jgi:FkbM family methyltransferase
MFIWKRKAVKYYSRKGEDFLLRHFFNKKRRGFFIDIGAFDGIHQSNTYTFEQMGWKGICIEPNPVIFQYCKKNRPRSLCLNEACVGSPEQGRVKFYIEDLGLLSTTVNNEEKQLDIQQRYAKRGLDFTGLKEIETKASTITQILDHHFPKLKKIDFMSIDTEGNEIDVINGIDFNKYDIRVLIIEANTDEEEKKLAKLLAEKGNFKPARRLQVNVVFVKTDEDLERMKNIRIDCRIDPQMHPLGTKFTQSIFFKTRVIRDP